MKQDGFKVKGNIVSAVTRQQPIENFLEDAVRSQQASSGARVREIGGKEARAIARANKAGKA